jgi:hypothetical protein
VLRGEPLDIEQLAELPAVPGHDVVVELVVRLLPQVSAVDEEKDPHRRLTLGLRVLQ